MGVGVALKHLRLTVFSKNRKKMYGKRSVKLANLIITGKCAEKHVKCSICMMFCRLFLLE